MQADRQPLVSVVIPCYNEEETIGQVLEALADQSYPLSCLEVLVVDGMSTDATRAQIAGFSVRRPELPVRVIDNPRRAIPTAMNLGIAQARGEYVMRMDAHAQPNRDYVARCVALLQAGAGDNVGGRWLIVPGAETSQARAIALAVSHPFGIGDARYRYGERAAYVDTVPFGAFRRDLFERVGSYDEQLLSNEDYDLNYRIRQAGGRIFFSPDIRCFYRARRTLAALARQYFRYGWWKVRMLRKYPAAIRWRQLAAPAFVAGLSGLGLLALLIPGIGWAWLALVAVYLLSGGILAVRLARRQGAGWRVAGWLLLAFATLHLSWGAGFWASLPGALLWRPRG